MVWKGFAGKALVDKLCALALKPSRGQFGGLRELEKLFAEVMRRSAGESVTAERLLDALKLRGVRS